MYQSVLIHSFIYGHLGCFQHLAIVSCAAMNIRVHRFFWIGVTGFLGYNPSSGIAGSKGSSIFSFLRKFHSVICLWALCMSSLEKCLFRSIAHFNWVVCLLGEESCNFFIYFGDQTLVRGIICKYLFPYGWFPFHLSLIHISEPTRPKR